MQWIKANPEIFQDEDWSFRHYRYTDGTKLDAELWDVKENGLQKKGGTGFLSFGQIEVLDEHTEWVSVESGNMPPVAQDVLVRVKDYKQTFVGFWNGFDFWAIFSSGLAKCDTEHSVTHWRNLSAPPSINPDK